MQNNQNIPRKCNFSTKIMSIFAHFYPQINSRVYTAIRYHRVGQEPLCNRGRFRIQRYIKICQ